MRTPPDGCQERRSPLLETRGICVLGRETSYGRLFLSSVLEGVGLELAMCKEVGDQAVPGSVKGWMEHIWKELETRLERQVQDQTLRSPVGEDKEQLIG